ncbi:DUF6235 family protein [Amycolatopsis magusensis]|uniref:Uncharacterized protein n=1 Tax=Amycolatopsis magusensis TaxID=882444 RepID=A0ABS4PQG6_9PSEU|nr:DUF6235 family protein [Amycolatopsis magusensis]MBP2181103.1 hypothetical protein [Amycolatopsis magusensis]MDI5974887.1 DUF6235 family protein [Amycolatopsis magusensis]
MTMSARLRSGMRVIEHWADEAYQAEKNALYTALFTVLDGSVFRTYEIIDDEERAEEFYVRVRPKLLMKIRLHHFDSFGVVFIGSPEDAGLPETPPAAGEPEAPPAAA